MTTMKSLQLRLNLIEKAIHEINLSSHHDRWLNDQDSHWYNGPLDPAYVEAKALLVKRRDELLEEKLTAEQSVAK